MNCIFNLVVSLRLRVAGALKVSRTELYKKKERVTGKENRI